MERRRLCLTFVGLAAAVLFLATGCSTPEEEMSPSEWIESHHTVFDQVGSLDEAEQRKGIQRLKLLGRQQGTSVVFWVINDPTLRNSRLEVMLARLLADWKDPRAIPFLLRNLTGTDDGAVRLASEGLLVFEDDPHVVRALGDMLNAEELRQRQTAARILAKIGTRQTTEMLGERIIKELDPEVQAQLLIGIIRGRHPRRAQYLIDGLASRDPAIRELAWGEIRKYRDLPRDIHFEPEAPDVERARAIGALRIWASRKRTRRQ